MKKYSALQFYLDTIEIQAAFGNDKLVKQAEEFSVSELISKIKEKLSGEKITKENVVNFLAPGAITLILNSLGFKWIGLTIGLALKVFNVDINSIIESMLSHIKPSIEKGEPITDEQLRQAANSSVRSSDESESELTKLKDWAKDNIKQLFADENNLYKYELYRYSLQQYKSTGTITKTAGVKTKTISLLMKAIFWIFKLILTSAGLYAAGKAVQSVTGIGSKEPTTPKTQSTQTFFKQNPSYTDEILNSGSKTWTELTPPTDSNINNMILDWMNSVYSNTEKYESSAQQTQGFKRVAQLIKDYNKDQTKSITIIPKVLESKKFAVDLFIDEVAHLVSKTNA